MKGDKKITLTEKELPTHWYNIVADMTNKPLPPLNPVTKQAASKEDFLPIFAEELVNQDFRKNVLSKFLNRYKICTKSGVRLR